MVRDLSCLATSAFFTRVLDIFQILQTMLGLVKVLHSSKSIAKMDVADGGGRLRSEQADTSGQDGVTSVFPVTQWHHPSTHLKGTLPSMIICTLTSWGGIANNFITLFKMC